MKIEFAQFDLMYPVLENVQLRFIAETEFEQKYLKALSRAAKEVSFQFQYPNYEPKDLNNPVIVLKVATEEK